MYKNFKYLHKLLIIIKIINTINSLHIKYICTLIMFLSFFSYFFIDVNISRNYCKLNISSCINIFIYSHNWCCFEIRRERLYKTTRTDDIQLRAHLYCLSLDNFETEWLNHNTSSEDSARPKCFFLQIVSGMSHSRILSQAWAIRL